MIYSNLLLHRHLLRAIQTHRGKGWMTVSWMLTWLGVPGLLQHLQHLQHLQRARRQAVAAQEEALQPAAVNTIQRIIG